MNRKLQIAFVVFFFLSILIATDKVLAQNCDVFNSYQYCEENGEITITGYTGSANDLVLPEEIDQKPVVAIGEGAFSGKRLTKVVFPNSLTEIGKSAFSWNHFTSITIPDNVIFIREYAFTHNNNLTHVVLPKNITSIEKGVFSSSGLQKVTIPAGVTSIEESAFSTNKNLMEVDIPHSVTSIGKSAFRNTQLTQVTIPSNVTEIADLTFAFSALEKVTISDNVTSIGESAFLENNLTSINLPSKLIEIGFGAFKDNALEEVRIPDGVTRIKDSVFANNELTNVRLPPNLTYIEDHAFQNNKLPEIIIPQSVHTIRWFAFENNELSKVHIPFGVETIHGSAFKDNLLQEIDIPPSVRHIGVDAFTNKLGDKFTISGFESSEAKKYAEKYDQMFTKIFHTLTYDGNGYEKGTPPVDTHEYDHRERTTVLSQGNLVRSGYAFSHWNTEVDGSGETYEVGATLMVTSHVTLYAQWLPGLTVQFDSQGGTFVDDVTVLGGRTLQQPTVSKSGFTLEGWYTDPAYTGKWDFTEDTVQQDLTLYAKWEDAYFNLSFDSTGGSVIQGQRVKYNDVGIKPQNPSRNGYTFTGWYLDASYTNEWDFQVNTVTTDTVLYAKWRRTHSGGGGSNVPPTTPPPVPETPEEPENPAHPEQPMFQDLHTHWARTMIEDLASKGIIKGYANGTFRPNETVERQQVALMLTRALELPIMRDELAFKDVPTHHPSYEAIRALQQAGIIDGSNGAFHPNRSLTRAEMAKILVLAFDLERKESHKFQDVSPTHWSYPYISTLAEHGIAFGTGGNFKPSDPITRAEFVAFMYRAMNLPK